jgi:alpha-galactosidase
VRALYALLQRLRTAHPGVEIESCASGGGRADFGILALTERIWTSDCNDPLERIAIQRGFQRFFPPEIMGAHLGPAPAHTTGRHHRLDFRAAVAVCGHFGIEADLDAMAPAERERLAGWIALHKRLRERVHGAEVHQGAGQDGISWTGYWHAARGQGLLCVWRHAAAGQRYPEALRLAWLVGIPELLVRACTPNDTLLPAEWQALDTGMRCHGPQLARQGLQLPPMLPESAWILELDHP